MGKSNQQGSLTALLGFLRINRTGCPVWPSSIFHPSRLLGEQPDIYWNGLSLLESSAAKLMLQHSSMDHNTALAIVLDNHTVRDAIKRLYLLISAAMDYLDNHSDVWLVEVVNYGPHRFDALDVIIARGGAELIPKILPPQSTEWGLWVYEDSLTIRNIHPGNLTGSEYYYITPTKTCVVCKKNVLESYAVTTVCVECELALSLDRQHSVETTEQVIAEQSRTGENRWM